MPSIQLNAQHWNKQKNMTHNQEKDSLYKLTLRWPKLVVRDLKAGSIHRFKDLQETMLLMNKQMWNLS